MRGARGLGRGGRGALACAGFGSGGRLPGRVRVIAAAKLQIKVKTEEQTRNKNTPKKNQSTEKNENNRKHQTSIMHCKLVYLFLLVWFLFSF